MRTLLAAGLLISLACPALAEDALRGPIYTPLPEAPSLPIPLPAQIVLPQAKSTIPAAVVQEPSTVHYMPVAVPTQSGGDPWYLKAYNGFMWLPRKVFIHPAAEVGNKIGVQDMTKRFWDREQQTGDWITRRLGWTSLPAQWLTAGSATYGASRSNPTTRF